MKHVCDSETGALRGNLLLTAKFVPNPSNVEIRVLIIFFY